MNLRHARHASARNLLATRSRVLPAVASSPTLPPLTRPLCAGRPLPVPDNLYLDMNGMLHQCSHPNDDEQLSQTLSTEDIVIGAHLSAARGPRWRLTWRARREARRAIQLYRPRRAHGPPTPSPLHGHRRRGSAGQDEPAAVRRRWSAGPRETSPAAALTTRRLSAGRSRRFRAALSQQRRMEEKREQGEPVEVDSQFDSNCITPGTAFMANVRRGAGALGKGSGAGGAVLGPPCPAARDGRTAPPPSGGPSPLPPLSPRPQIDRYIKYFVRKKMKEDPLWQGITVIYSSHAVPGEGEHKIMNFIRAAKEEPDYPPNLRHCMYGLDADLVMLCALLCPGRSVEHTHTHKHSSSPPSLPFSPGHA